jgi:hypothetical protein
VNSKFLIDGALLTTDFARIASSKMAFEIQMVANRQIRIKIEIK